MPRIANYKIDAQISQLNEFENYNGTITAIRFSTDNGTIYAITHWSTRILAYNLDTHKIEFLALGKISQTTSTLVGRILRNLPPVAVLDLLNTPDLSKPEQKRLAKMARLIP
jgi:hypothetical protein